MDLLFFDGDTAYRATVGGFMGAFRPFRADHPGLSSVLVKLKYFRAYLGAHTATDALFSIYLHLH